MPDPTLDAAALRVAGDAYHTAAGSPDFWDHSTAPPTLMPSIAYDPARGIEAAITAYLRATTSDPAKLRERVARVWLPPDTAPIDGREFLALLSNDWRTILFAHSGIRSKGCRYQWWGKSGGLGPPYEPSHPADTDWSRTARLVGWMELPSADAAIAEVRG